MVREIYRSQRHIDDTLQIIAPHLDPPGIVEYFLHDGLGPATQALAMAADEGMVQTAEYHRLQSQLERLADPIAGWREIDRGIKARDQHYVSQVTTPTDEEIGEFTRFFEIMYGNDPEFSWMLEDLRGERPHRTHIPGELFVPPQEDIEVKIAKRYLKNLTRATNMPRVGVTSTVTGTMPGSDRYRRNTHRWIRKGLAHHS